MDSRILAKSAQGGNAIDLYEHTEAVVRAAEYLFGCEGVFTPLLRAWLRFFGLSEEAAAHFHRNLILACIFHDFGKTSDGFQQMLRRKGEQAVRHEHLSALLLSSEPLRSWVSACEGVDRHIVIAAVASHHLKVSDKEIGKVLTPGERAVHLSTGAQEIRACLQLATPILGTPPGIEDRTFSLAALDNARAAFVEEAYRFKTELRRAKGGERHRMLLAVKAGLIAADSAGSALVREGMRLDEWIDGCFATPLTAAWVEDNIINPRRAEIEKRSGRPFVWQEFQIAAGRLGPRALLIASCGAGKTLAAWRWIACQLERRPASRVIFLYPTRATATEGFRDYVSWAGVDAALQSGTAAYDIEGMFDNANDRRRDGDYHVAERLFALGFWPKRAFSATVDSFLAFMANQYGPICMLPVLCDSIVVFDEVHSFDQIMFAALERFLTFFNETPVMCMTASLPEDRKRILVDTCGLDVFPSQPGQFADLQLQSDAPRYVVTVADEQHALERVRIALTNGKRVLWVVNQVRRCQDRFKQLRAMKNAGVMPDVPVLCYHSRFRLKDRKARHEAAVAAFQTDAEPKVLVTTQVCEMSLDLNADLLVTEAAPIPSLIQRMGRCCRVPLPNADRLGEVVVYKPENIRPYTREEIEQGSEFALSISRDVTPVSQSRLALELERAEVLSPFASDQYSDFLDAGTYAMARENPFRDTDEFTVDAVLDADIETYLKLRAMRDPKADGLILPIPRRHALEDTRLGRFLRAASVRHYSMQYGFSDTEVMDE